MPIMSYLAYPLEGRMDPLIQELQAIPGCDVIASENAPVAILVTETETAKQEEELQELLQNTRSLQCLAMVFGHTEQTERHYHD